MPQPVTVFLRQSLTLRAACAACLDKPKPKPVHQLRSASRRLEATIELLAENAGIPGLRSSWEPLRRSLRKIRRAAGAVRDVDVHRELLRAYPKSDEAASLDDELHRSRDKAAQKLQKRLGKDERRIQRDLDDLEAALMPALDVELSGAELAGFARRWFARSVRKLDVEHEDQLHAMRKASKTARYLAETGAEVSKTARAVAARFEEEQQTLGEWHDHLLLLDEARANCKRGSELVTQIAGDCQRLREGARISAERLLKSSDGQSRGGGISKARKTPATRGASL